MKKISIFTPCYNEEENVYDLCMAVKSIMSKMSNYEYEHVLIDNASTDNTWQILKKLASEDRRIKVIQNERNFGPSRSGSHGFFQTDGDASICMACDFQDPPELIPQFISKWEGGYKVVWGKKTSSEENRSMFLVRSIYYKIIGLFSDVKQYEQVTGFGLYDKKVVDLMRLANDPNPNFRNLIAEYGYEIGLIEYAQPKRKAGKSSYNFLKYFNIALISLVNTSTIPLRVAVFVGFFISIVSFILALIYLVLKLLNWNSFNMGIAPIIISIFFLGGVQLAFLGVLGEYIGEILARVKNTPLVVERSRINFEEDKDDHIS